MLKKNEKELMQLVKIYNECTKNTDKLIKELEFILSNFDYIFAKTEMEMI